MLKHSDSNLSAAENAETYLADYLEHIPAIVWRIDIVRNEISFLNSYTIPAREEKVRAILQDTHLAKTMILPEDREQFTKCYKQIRNRIKTACVFRLRLEKGVTRWFKLAAMPDPNHHTSSIGMLMDISPQVKTVLATDGMPTLSTKIDLIKDPVLLVHFSDRKIRAANKAAKQFLRYDDDKLLSLTFQELLQHNTSTSLHQMYEGLIFSDSWSGKLNVSDSQGRSHQCSTHVQAIAHAEENLLWVTMTHNNDCLTCKGTPVHGNEAVPLEAVTNSMRKCGTIKELLEAMLKALPTDSPTDAIMLSRIFIDKNTVVVIGAGEPFETVSENHIHPYEGSIAENIVRFDLQSHVVMETSKSIKPIDWALFIPRGIRSYYAQPFYEKDVLTSVLIFCSTKGQSYDPDANAPLLALHEEFLKNLKRCLHDR